MTSVLALFVLVLSVSFLCSLLEAIFLSVSPGFVATLAKERASGRLLEHLKENINRPISAILTLNTTVNTLGSAVIGAKVQELYGNEAVSILSAVLTLSILILSEIFPKILGATYNKQLAPFAAYIIQILIFLMYPIVRLSEILANLVRRSEDEISMTREELISTAEIGVDEGTLHKKESAIIKNLLMLNNIYVSDIMTPRSVFFALEASETVEEVSQRFKPIRFSRIPVYQDSLDNIIGLTHRYKILEALSNDQHAKTIKETVSPINTVSERMTVASAIDYFIKHKEHLALAADEYGVITGLVTLEDAIETLLGVEIVDEFDNITDMRQYALEQWQIRKQSLRKPT
ncbi:MAG: hemolysin family protein [Proteobacteria bacterium]|jgi:CBS domain containing-hemolysin-like protein|nr:hemolysin family protein [Pseudomonadota bacterium]